MPQFTIAIAGHAVAVSHRFESTRYYCRNYLTEAAPEFAVEAAPGDLTEEQAELRAEALREGLKPRIFPEPFLERSVIQRKLAEALLDRDILLFHGSLVAVDGEGYLFTARCGTGKSTHTRLWCQQFGPRAVMVNDDKPFLHLGEGGVTAYGSPWSGKHGLDTNVAVPLKGICILERGSENRIRPMAAEEALPLLEAQSAISGGEPLVRRLAARVPLWKMHCTRDLEAARVAYAAMANAGPCTRCP